jgi:hypothetical protein
MTESIRPSGGPRWTRAAVAVLVAAWLAWASRLLVFQDVKRGFG